MSQSLDIRCPHCSNVFRVSFVNPLKELISGRMKWSALPAKERRSLLLLGTSLLICLGLILGSFLLPSPVERAMPEQINTEIFK